MDQHDHPGFRALATEDDDSRWRADQAALRHGRLGRSGVAADAPLAFEPSSARRPAGRRRRTPLLVGGGLAVVTAALLAAPLLVRHPGPTTSAPPLSVEVDKAAPTPEPVTPRRSLPCYVDGVSVGAMPLMDCASRNGVAGGRLDVGLDRPSTAPAAASVQPQPPPPRLAIAEPPPPLPVTRPREVPTPRVEASPRAISRPAPYAPAPLALPIRPAPAPARLRADLEGPSAAESAQAAGDFYTALREADGERAASLVIPEKRGGGAFSAPAIDRFYSSLRAPLRITDLRPLDSRRVAVRYQFIDPEGYLCSGSSEVDTTVRRERVLIESIRTRSRC